MLKIENLTITYPTKDLLGIKNLSFELPKGSICLLSGDSGSGKTTLCLAIAGLLMHARPEAAISGFIGWDKKLISQKVFNPEIAITLENPYSQLTGLKHTVCEELAFGLEMQGVPRKEIIRRIQLIGDKFDIVKLLSRDPRTLSGGEIQKIVISCSYVQMPKLWVLDWPLTELDPLMRLTFLEELELMANQNGTTIFISEEPAADIYSIATHLLIIKKTGEVEFSLNAKKGHIEAVDSSILPRTITFSKTKGSNVGIDSFRYPLVEVKELGFQYSPDQLMIFEDLSIRVNSGECLWITGPNGCGKTTLAKILVGILKPKKGEVFVNKISPITEPIWKVARHAAYAFQNPDIQIFSTNVWNEIFFGPKALGHPEDKCTALTNYALDLFGLGNKKKIHPHDLNRSERKRLGLASAFAMDTPVMILDEPTQFQNTQGKQLVKTAMNEVLSKGKSILCITHDLGLIRFKESTIYP